MIKEQKMSLDAVVPGESYEKCIFLYSSEPLRFDGVTFSNCIFQQEDFSHSDWSNCILNNCQFLNNNFTNSLFFQTKFNKCQLLGADFSNNTWKKVNVIDCKADYCNFSVSKLVGCSFTDTGLLEAYFQEVSVRQKLIYTNCQMDGVDFLGTLMKGVDLSRSYFEDLRVAPNLVKGCIIASVQAPIFANLLGVQIKD